MSSSVTAPGRTLAHQLMKAWTEPLGDGNYPVLLDQCSRLCRSAPTYKRMQERACSEPIDDQEGFDRAEATKEKTIRRIVENLPHPGQGHWSAFFQGDPRGPTIKIKSSDPEVARRTYDCIGGEGVCVPNS